MCQRERELHLLDHIEFASVLATQLGSKSEAILLRKGVLRNAVAEKDELIHRQSKRAGRFPCDGELIFICWWFRQVWTRARSIPPTSSFFRASGPTLHLSSGDTGVWHSKPKHMPSRALRKAEEDRLSVSQALRLAWCCKCQSVNFLMKEP